MAAQPSTFTAHAHATLDKLDADIKPADIALADITLADIKDELVEFKDLAIAKTDTCYELTRFRTPEAWLVCYPAIWGLCLTAGARGPTLAPSPPELLGLLTANCISMTLGHGTFCVLNDIIDARIDAKIARTKTRPIPSGRISRHGAFVEFCALLIITSAVSYGLLGRFAFALTLPSQLVSAGYPFAKRLLPWPQFVLAPACAWPMFVGAASVAGREGFGEAGRKLLPLYAAFCLWVISFDTLYALQDAAFDRRDGNGNLAVAVGDRMKVFQGFMGSLVVALLAAAAKNADASWFFWSFAVGAWALFIPVQLAVLDLKRPKTGAWLFKANIVFGMYISAVMCVELIVKISR